MCVCVSVIARRPAHSTLTRTASTDSRNAAAAGACVHECVSACCCALFVLCVRVCVLCVMSPCVLHAHHSPRQLAWLRLHARR
jgi:hypothetical protein